MVNGVKAYYHIVFDSETVVFDGQDKKIVSCPTEKEAIDYINENSKEEII